MDFLQTLSHSKALLQDGLPILLIKKPPIEKKSIFCDDLGVYILTVHPIQRSAFKETLTYWAPNNFPAGSIIYVPFRNKNILALVESCINATESKADIKNADFIARKIESKKTITAVSPSLIKACQAVSKEFAYPIGAIIKTIIPECALLYAEEVINKKSKTATASVTTELTKESTEEDEDQGFTDQPSSRDIYVFQTNTADRYGTYKSIIREEFAKKRSVIIIAPTVNSAEEIFEELSRGISDYAYLLHGGLNKKKQVETWGKALNESHTIALITTPSFVGLPRTDIATIVVERESSRSYITMFKPLFDYRYLFQKWSKELRARLIYGDVLLRVETLHKRERGEVYDFFPISMRIDKRPNTIIVDMSEPIRKEKAKKEKDKINSKNNLIYSEELESQVEYAGKKKEKMIIFTARRGLAPQTVCGDCGTTVTCSICEAPVVLHNSKVESKRYFLCHHCGRERTALEGCKNCGSWKLITLGIGSDTIHEETQKRFPDRQIFRLDRDTAKTDKQARDIAKKFDESTSGILIGTEFSLNYLKPVKHVAIASLDSLFSLPDFRINERICHILLQAQTLAEEYLLIQSRNATHPLLGYIQSGNLNDFYKSEISDRKALMYPPFSAFIKITIEADKTTAAKEMGKLQVWLEKWNPTIFPAFVPSVGGKSILHMLISMSPKAWPDEELRDILVGLPPEFTVSVHPESLL
jgi:primosomal protein N' (replication factor Y)